MTILESELLLLKSITVSDDDTNGGKMNNNASVTSGVTNNVWPSVFKAERTAGSTKYRKLFYKIANDDDLTLYSPQLWLDIVTPGDDWMVMFAGTQTDTQADITGSEALFGCATLNADASSSDTTVDVEVEDSSLLPAGSFPIFYDGQTIRITDKATPSGTGNEEMHVINGTPSVVSGNVIRITLTDALGYDFTTANSSRVMGVYEPSDAATSIDSWVETVAGDGSFDHDTYALGDDIGTIEESYTLTFSSATAFSVVDSSSASVGSGTTSADFAPTNSDVSKPLFTLESAGWSGTFASGDEITFSTHPASIPIWQKRVVPAGAGSLSGDKTTVVLTGEST